MKNKTCTNAEYYDSECDHCWLTDTPDPNCKDCHFNINNRSKNV